MGKYELPPDYKCPYCGTGHDADYDVWEGVDYERMGTTASLVQAMLFAMDVTAKCQKSEKGDRS